MCDLLVVVGLVPTWSLALHGWGADSLAPSFFGAAAFLVSAADADSLSVMWVGAWDACGVWFGVFRA